MAARVAMGEFVRLARVAFVSRKVSRVVHDKAGL